MNVKDKWLPMPRFLLRLNALKQILRSQQVANKKCLEIGFGAGEVLKYMAKRGANVTGFDFSKKAMEIANNRISQSKYADAISITADESSLKKGYYDFVLAFEVLEHIEKDEEAFNQWLSYLKPGGSLFFSVPAHMSKWNDSDAWAGHYRRYEKQDLIDVFQKKNLKIVRLWNYGFPLSLVLDKLLGVSKKVVMKKHTDNISKADLSKNSGIDRDNKLIYKLISNNVVLYPFYLLQRLFFNKDMGSGYIVHVVVDEK